MPSKPLSPPPRKNDARFDTWVQFDLYERLKELGEPATFDFPMTPGQAAELIGKGSSLLHYHAEDRKRANHTGTQLASTISDLEAVVGSMVQSSSGHNLLTNLAWSSSGHNGSANNLAGFNGSGAASYYSLGTGVATFLATPSSANLAAAIADETGTAGSVVFSAGPTFTGTVLMAALTTTGNTILGDASADTLNVGNGDLIKDALGNVGIGTTPTNAPSIGNPVTGAHNLVLYNAGNLGLTLLTDAGGTRTQQIGFGAEGVSTFDAGLKYDNTSRTLQFWGGAAVRLNLTQDGRLYGTALHNNAGAVTGTTNQYIASGTYTPSATGLNNLDSVTPAASQWMRVGNVVTVSGKAAVDATSAGTPFFNLSLPITSSFSATTNAAGAGVTADIAHGAVQINANAGASTVQFLWSTTVTTANEIFFTFTYVIL